MRGRTRMDASQGTSFARQLQQRVATEGAILSMPGGVQGLFDPGTAAAAEAANARDLKLPQGIVDLLRVRRRSPVAWSEVRAAISQAARSLNTAPILEALYARMRSRFVQPGDVDLTATIQRSIGYGLLPLVVDCAAEKGRAAVVADYEAKLANLLAQSGGRRELRYRLGDALAQMAAGRAVVRELDARKRGRVPQRDDFAHAMLAFGDRLTTTGATYAITGMLTAISGAPGSIASCLLFELLSRDEWRARIERELAALPQEQLFASPARHAPTCLRFIKEVLRLWSFPLISSRRAHRDIRVGDLRIAADQHYLVSSFLIHHAEAHWPAAETFDPDRWLHADESARAPGTYVPFGWAPRSCPGASLGLSQLVLFCRLALVECDVRAQAIDRAFIALDGFAVPKHFRGTISLRVASAT